MFHLQMHTEIMWLFCAQWSLLFLWHYASKTKPIHTESFHNFFRNDYEYAGYRTYEMMESIRSNDSISLSYFSQLFSIVHFPFIASWHAFVKPVRFYLPFEGTIGLSFYTYIPGVCECMYACKHTYLYV